MIAFATADFTLTGDQLVLLDVKGCAAFRASGNQVHRLVPVSSAQPSIKMGVSMSNHSLYTSATIVACGSSIPERAIRPCFLQADASAGARTISALERIFATTISACS